MFIKIKEKLDRSAIIDYEKTRDPDQAKTISGLLAFIEKRYKTFVNVGNAEKSGHNSQSNVAVNRTFVTTQEKKREGKICAVCSKKGHKATACFSLRNADDKRKLLLDKNLCLYCASHPYKKGESCKVKDRLNCAQCHKNHLTILHGVFVREPKKNNDNPTGGNQQRTTLLSVENVQENMILPSVKVNVQGTDGQQIPVTGLIDSCSTMNYITTSLARKLKLELEPYEENISGLGGVKVAAIEFMTVVTLSSMYHEENKIKIRVFVTPKITKTQKALSTKRDKRLNAFKLADPNFDSMSKIEFMLGIGVFPKVFLRRNRTFGDLLCQETIFGWLVSGIAEHGTQYPSRCLVTLNEIDQHINDCFKMPEMNASPEEEGEFCRKVFKNESFQDSDGRFHVPLFIKPGHEPLENSYDTAVKNFIRLEKSLEKNPEKKALVNGFMLEYLALGHMSLVPEKADTSGETYYVPYHPIFKLNKLTTKCRNVFNFSSKTSNGVSLNDILYSGPNLLVNVINALTTMRVFPIAIMADIEKMYRQFKLLTPYQRFQRVLWRANEHESLAEYELHTVTYGVNCAPALALLVLETIAQKAPKELQEALIGKFYMDDWLCGAFTTDEASKMCRDVFDELSKAQLTLRKFACNDAKALSKIPEEHRIEAFMEKDSGEKMVKVLGYNWNLSDDTFSVNIPEHEIKGNLTKRKLLSCVASLYDPLGLLLPVAVLLRLFMQQVWSQKLDWDQAIPKALADEFLAIFASLPLLKTVTINRWLQIPDKNGVELIGFSDASKEAASCVIYTRVKNSNENYAVSLLCARAHLTPIHVKSPNGFNVENFTTPKLELYGLKMLAELISKIKESFAKVKITKIIAFTDSEVVIHWLRATQEGSISKKVMKRHATAVLKVIKLENIHHIESKQNPADLISRGVKPSDLSNSEIWFQGPKRLQSDIIPQKYSPLEVSLVTMAQNSDESDVNFISDLLQKDSSFTKLTRLVARMMRWLNNIPKRRKSEGRVSGPLTPPELEKAEIQLIKLQQKVSFPEEIKNLSKGLPIPRSSKLLSLRPFLGQDELLRVGGRLERNDLLSYSERHPVIIDNKSILALPLIRRAHLNWNHGPNHVTQRELRAKYWIISAKETIKRAIKSCPKCIRHNGKCLQPPMGQLPPERTTPAPCFAKTGVDFAGPFHIKASNLRGTTTTPAYIALFICLFTRAVHIEVCSQLTADCFLAAYKRFCARRGTPTTMFSDNGSNFQAASKALRNTMLKIRNEFITQVQNVQWKFNPPLAPDMGGLWESNIKSFKTCLYKTINSTIKFTLEEFSTIAIAAEACLNSRPLAEIYENPDEELPLTPFHFLIHRGFKPIPEEELSELKTPPTKRWQHVNYICQKLWSYFRHQVMDRIQRTKKYQTEIKNLKKDDIVILKEDNVPPAVWPMGKVVNTYPGIDGVTRVVDIKTTKGTYKRKVNKIIPLLLLLLIQSPTKTSGVTFTPLTEEVYVYKDHQLMISHEAWHLTLETGINRDKDLQTLEQLTTRVKKLCDESAQCLENYNGLVMEVDRVKRIMEQSRRKRWAQLLTTAGPYVVKALPWIATAAAAVYQQIQIEKMDTKVVQLTSAAQTQEKLLKLLTEKFNSNAGKLEDSINDYLTTVEFAENISIGIVVLRMTIERYRSTYENLVTTYVTQCGEDIQDLKVSLGKKGKTLPALIDAELLTIYEPVVSQEGGELSVNFKVPIVEVYNATKYGIIAFPTQGKVRPIDRFLIMTPGNKSKIDHYDRIIVTREGEIIENPEVTRLNTCDLEIINGSINKCQAKETDKADLWRRINDFKIAFKTKDPFNISCPPTELITIHKPQGILQLKGNCKIDSPEFEYTVPNALWTKRTIAYRPNDTTFELKPVTIKRITLDRVDPKILEPTTDWDRLDHPWAYLTITVLTTLTIGKLCHGCTRYLAKKRNLQTATPTTPVLDAGVNWSMADILRVEDGQVATHADAELQCKASASVATCATELFNQSTPTDRTKKL